MNLMKFGRGFGEKSNSKKVKIHGFPINFNTGSMFSQHLVAIRGTATKQSNIWFKKCVFHKNLKDFGGSLRTTTVDFHLCSKIEIQGFFFNRCF